MLAEVNLSAELMTQLLTTPAGWLLCFFLLVNGALPTFKSLFGSKEERELFRIISNDHETLKQLLREVNKNLQSLAKSL